MAWGGNNAVDLTGAGYLTNILYAAIHLVDVPPIPEEFEELRTSDGTSGRPDLSALTTDEQDTITAWIADLEKGGVTPPPEATYNDGTAFSGAANTKVTDYLVYRVQSDYKNWSSDKYIDRWAQWRIRCAIILFRSADAQTKPKSADSGGVGANQLTAPIDHF